MVKVESMSSYSKRDFRTVHTMAKVMLNLLFQALEKSESRRAGLEQEREQIFARCFLYHPYANQSGLPSAEKYQVFHCGNRADGGIFWHKLFLFRFPQAAREHAQ